MITNRLSTTFLMLLIAASLQLPVFSQYRALRSYGFQSATANESESHISSEFDCLPEDYKLTDIVSYRHKPEGGTEHITIKDTLVKMKARCEEGKLIDHNGREIRFFKIACFGNPPNDYDEIRQKEAERLAELQKDYTVIVLECDPNIS